MQKSDLSFKYAEYAIIKSHMSYYKKDMFVCVQKIYSSIKEIDPDFREETSELDDSINPPPEMQVHINNNMNFLVLNNCSFIDSIYPCETNIIIFKIRENYISNVLNVFDKNMIWFFLV